MASILDSLRQEAECSLCHKTPSEPKILKCFHTFCNECLTEKSAEFKGDGETFSCPSCKTRIDLPQRSDFGSLECSGFHSRILEVLSLASASDDNQAAKCPCKRGNPAVAHCFECARHLCDVCSEAHDSFTDGHRTANLKELTSEDYKLFLNRETPCEKASHMEEFVKFYCNTCGECACQLCILEEHQGLHDIINIELRAQMQRNVLQSLLQKLKVKEAEQLKNMRYLEEMSCTMKTSAEDTKIKVRQAAERLIEFIEQSNRELVCQLDREVSMVGTKRDEQESLLHQTRSASEYIARLVDYGSAYLIMSNNKTVQTRCEELITSDTGFAQVEHRKKFVPSDAVSVLRELGLGSLRETKPSDPTRSSVTTEGCSDTMSTVKLTVHTKTVDGDPNTDPDDVIEITVEPKDDVMEIKTTDKIGDKYQAIFTPKVPGKYKTEVKINGRHISNSPMEICIKPQRMRYTREMKTKGSRDPLEKPWGIAVNRSNTKLAVTDCHFHYIVIFNMTGKVLMSIGSQGRGEGQLGNPHGVAFLNDDVIVTADEYNHRIQLFDTNTGRCLKSFGHQGNGDGEFKNPLGVDVDDNGRIIISDYLNNRVQVFTSEGEYLFQFDLEVHGEVMYPVHTRYHDNAFYVSDFRNHVIHVFDEQDDVVTRRAVIGREGNKEGEFSYPRGIAFDSVGNLIVCDRNNHRLLKFTREGRLIGHTTQYLGLPIYATVLRDGKILVTDDEKKRVLFVEQS
ncbi:E3 ubiquitin-protein ligase TRIM71 [Nematostella vectensis]|nr:E3 ubiquitin-protein ligase TRIM71 [Nematostella vectensis]